MSYIPPTLYVNKATEEDLRQIRGIGQTTAKAIVRLRERRGYLDIEDLRDLPQKIILPPIFHEIANYDTVEQIEARQAAIERVSREIAMAESPDKKQSLKTFKKIQREARSKPIHHMGPVIRRL